MGLDINKIERFTVKLDKDGNNLGTTITMRSTKYVPKGRTDMNNYTDGERAIIGDCVIKGTNYDETVFRVLNEGSGSTVLNKGTFDIVNRIRDYKYVDGVNHWVVNNKELEYYINNDISDSIVA
jgi:hypothetical protein